MGYVRHDAVIVTMPGSILRGGYAIDVPVPDIDVFRASLPENWRPLVVGPAYGVVNDICTVAFLPDGSKEGWDESNAGDEYRAQFLELFSWRYPSGGSPFDIVSIRYGSDTRDFEPEIVVEYGDGKRLASMPEEYEDHDEAQAEIVPELVELFSRPRLTPPPDADA